MPDPMPKQVVMLVPIHRTMQAALDAALTVIDEEDAVLLYRVTRLAESSPELVEATDMRRTAIHSSMKRDFDQLWLSLQHELCETIERSMEEHVQLTRTTHEHVRKVEAESLSKARVASEVRVQHLLVEKDSELKRALRLQASARAHAHEIAAAWPG